MTVSKYDISELDKILGKKVKCIQINETWRENGDIEDLIITFDDDSNITIGSYSNTGCDQCDPDGCEGSTLNIS